MRLAPAAFIGPALLLALLARPAGAGEPRPEDEEEDSWLDVSHAFLERTLLAPTLAFDRFFSDERELEAERGRSFLRWRNEVRLTEDVPSPAFTTGVRANLRFPGVSRRLRRLRLVIAGETSDAWSALFPGEGDRPAAGVREPPLGRADAGLRVDLLDTVLAHVDLGGGVLVDLPPGGYGRVRVRWAIPVPRILLSRWAVTGFWRTDVHFGATGALELERPLGRRLSARLSGGATITEESPGFEWGSEAALLASLGPRSALLLAGGPSGATRGEIEIERWRLYTRIRSDVYRRWIFVEAEPEVAWPWTPERGRHSVFALTFRLEVQFHGAEAVRAREERRRREEAEGKREDGSRSASPEASDPGWLASRESPGMADPP